MIRITDEMKTNTAASILALRRIFRLWQRSSKLCHVRYCIYGSYVTTKKNIVITLQISKLSTCVAPDLLL